MDRTRGLLFQQNARMKNERKRIRSILGFNGRIACNQSARQTKRRIQQNGTWNETFHEQNERMDINDKETHSYEQRTLPNQRFS